MNVRKLTALALLSWCASGFAPTAWTAPPPKVGSTTSVAVTSATPASAYQDTTIDVVVGGSNFDRTATVQYLVSGSTTDSGGVTVTKVTYKSASQLVTTLAVAKKADLSNFDIIVTLSDGRKGKGTTLFRVQAPPTYPPGRAWHAFTSNGGADVASSRLFMYGGADSTPAVVPADLWRYSAYDDRWTLVNPASTARPGARQWEGLSCGGGACVMADGSNGAGLVDETWVYTEGTNAWIQATCSRKILCPSARQMATMAFDPNATSHMMFGGRGSTAGLNDTWTFDTATIRWTLQAPALKPTERNRAAALYVPGIGVVMHGGQGYHAQGPYCDMYAWSGSNWRQIQFDKNQPYPCLHTHSMAWDGQGLVVTGGFVDTNDTPNTTSWRFTFAADGQSGVWSPASGGVCLPVLGTDATIHPGAKMAYDVPTATRVWFGGEENINGSVVRYGNTVECQ
jgi:hypothetical protein